MADLNGDAKPDVVMANQNGNDIWVQLGNGTATFPAAKNYPVGTQPYGGTIADVNGDGKLDLVIANVGSHDVSVLFAN
jgi:hypothetical protein